MATYVQIVNRVLRRLREDQVSNYDDTDYSTLLGDLVNETIADMQDRVDWNALLDDFTVTLDGSSRVYALTSALSANSRDANDQTEIREVFDDTNDWLLIRAQHDWVTRAKLQTPDPDNTIYWREVGEDASGRRQLEFYPDVAATINVSTYNPHGEIAASATVVKLPSRIVTLGTYALAVNERGEDGGTQATAAWNLYNNALGAAIATDWNRRTADEQTWSPE